MSDKMIYRGDLMGGVTMSDREGYLQRRDQLLMQDEEIAELKQQLAELREALNEAMGWNWLDDDMNDEVANRLYALLQEKGE